MFCLLLAIVWAAGRRYDAMIGGRAEQTPGSGLAGMRHLHERMLCQALVGYDFEFCLAWIKGLRTRHAWMLAWGRARRGASVKGSQPEGERDCHQQTELQFASLVVVPCCSQERTRETAPPRGLSASRIPRLLETHSTGHDLSITQVRRSCPTWRLTLMLLAEDDPRASELPKQQKRPSKQQSYQRAAQEATLCHATLHLHHYCTTSGSSVFGDNAGPQRNNRPKTVRLARCPRGGPGLDTGRVDGLGAGPYPTERG